MLRTAPLTDAQRSLYAALIEFRDTYLDREITVKALCSTAHVARSTFYAYYHNVDEVLAGIEHELVAELLEINSPLMSKAADPLFFRETLEYVRAHELTFHALLIAAPDRRFIEAWKNAIKYHLWERLFGEGRFESAPLPLDPRPTANRELLLEMVAAMVIDALAFSLEHPTEVDEREVGTIVASVLDSIDVVL